MIRCIALAALVFTFLCSSAQNPVGIFDDHTDVGTVLHPGSTTFDSAKNIYTVRGSGENMWATQDGFQFAWKKISGDVEITADVFFSNTSGNPHKKAVLMFRQSLDPDSVYADVALHASDLLSLQYRNEKGGMTTEVEANQGTVEFSRLQVVAGPEGHSAPEPSGFRLQLARRGNYAYVSFDHAGRPARFEGQSVPISLQGDFYVGIGVCSHDKNVVEEATFSNVEIKKLEASSAAPVLYSTLETVTLDTTIRHVIYSDWSHFEAPNWSRDGSYFLFNRNGHLEKLPVSGGAPKMISTAPEERLNNDHGISPNGTMLAISDNSQPTKSPTGQETHDSLVYVLPITGGTPRRLTPTGPSYWHGWSPDGKTLAFVALRNGDFDIYTVPVTGGDETRLTTAKGLDDGPEYSPDGQYIYFNSERTGHMQIWRMKPDGSNQEQVFSDEYNNWFPHISPDGKWMVFLTYERDVTGHPENKDVMLRLMSLADKKITVLAKLFGGQGTINVPSWSPDSKSLAFVSYELIPPDDAPAAH